MFRLAAPIACLLGCTGLAAPVPTHLIPPVPPAYYPTTPGTRLVYLRNGEIETRIVETVEAKEGGKLATTVRVREDGTKSPFHTVRITAKGVFILETNAQRYPAPFELIRLPFKPDSTWNEVEGNAGYGTRKAIRKERIKVAAGEFECLRIESTHGQSTTRHWYAAGIGVVKVDYGSSILELKSIDYLKR